MRVTGREGAQSGTSCIIRRYRNFSYIPTSPLYIGSVGGGGLGYQKILLKEFSLCTVKICAKFEEEANTYTKKDIPYFGRAGARDSCLSASLSLPLHIRPMPQSSLSIYVPLLRAQCCCFHRSLPINFKIREKTEEIYRTASFFAVALIFSLTPTRPHHGSHLRLSERERHR